MRFNRLYHSCRLLLLRKPVKKAAYLKKHLELSGFEVNVANDGKEGLEKALKEENDLIILDLMLPEVDGFEICRKVRAEKNTPIIMVSAKKDDIDKISGLGYITDTDLVIACMSKAGKPYIRVFEDCVKNCHPIPDKQGEYKGAHYEIREVQLDTGKDNYETREIELNYNIWYKFVD